MKFSLSKVWFPFLFGGLLLLAFGCTQQEDVVQPLSSSTITLNPHYLPELDSIYVYQIWMVKVQNPGDDFTAAGAQFIPLRKFLWDNSVDRFRDLNGNLLTDDIELPESWFAYDYIVVSVENVDDKAPDEPSGVYMLYDDVVDPVTRPIVMKFPANLFLTTGAFFVGTPTNDTTYWDFTADSLVRVSEEENKGLWICSRFLTERYLHDTLGVDSFNNSQFINTDTTRKYEPDTINVKWPDDSTWTIIIDTVVYGYDTLQHRRIDLEYEVIYDTVYDYNLYPYFQIDSITTLQYPYPLGRIPYWEYSGPIAEAPDIYPYGWYFNSWVMLEQPAGGDNSGMDLSTMIPFGTGEQEAFTGQNTWGVLPLGPFRYPDMPDLNNPYIDNREVPQFPGEDFVVGASAFANLNLRRIADHTWGFVIVGMEPRSDLLTTDENTNFPLFILSAEIPQGNADIYTDGNPNNDSPTFHNWTQFLPEIDISVDMHD